MTKRTDTRSKSLDSLNRPQRDKSLSVGGQARNRSISLLSSTTIGATNRGRLLQALFDLGPASRADLARYAEVNRTTISGIVQPLIDGDVLVEGGPLVGGSTLGKPSKPLWFSSKARPICGVLLMPDKVSACLATLQGTIDAEHLIELPKSCEQPEPVIDAVLTCIAEVMSKARRAPIGIGVAVGGMVDTDTGSIVKVNLTPSLDGYPLERTLGDHFRLPVRIDHHPRALLVGDRWFGAGRSVPQFAAVYTGEVLGGALYVDGHLLRGGAGAGGELGHTFVQYGGELCHCGKRGCWDTIATLSWLRRKAEQIGLESPETMNSERLVALCDQSGAAELLDLYAQNVAIGLANLQQTIAPDTFILHGDVVSGGARLLDSIAGHVRNMVPSRPGSVIDVVAGDAGDGAALLGAAGLVLSDLLQFNI